MNKYIRALVVIPTGIIKTTCLKLFHPKKFTGVQFAQISPRTEFTLNGGGLKLGKKFKMRDGSKLRIRKGAILSIGNNVSISSNCIITSRVDISIGDNVQISPCVQIYDHDHDFRCEGGLKSKNYNCNPIKIGNNVWIGCNTVILKGSTIGDNCVIAAGSIVKGVVPENTILVQKKIDTIIDMKE